MKTVPSLQRRTQPWPARFGSVCDVCGVCVCVCVYVCVCVCTSAPALDILQHAVRLQRALPVPDRHEQLTNTGGVDSAALPGQLRVA